MASLQPRYRSVFPNIADWLGGSWLFGERNPVRIEESMGEGKYLVRAELPGFDPARQIHVAAESGLLTISAERESETTEQGRSEFRYGSFSRSVSLPAGADTDHITATYANGILEVAVPIERQEPPKTVQIKVNKS
ncbi:Hsp20/alpha crystallin family protein [Saccharomonospora sp. NPDC046836]|uniref:Hsp20/alpha crystallin family protein n=1 Tax=Saccharomonospora sp. NPDC046836 TaxID=3156921 RepID=UPI0033E3F208